MKNETDIALPESCGSTEEVLDVLSPLDTRGFMVYQLGNVIEAWQLACWAEEVDRLVICYSAPSD